MNKRVLFIDDQLDIWEKPFRVELGKEGFDILCDEDPSKAVKLIASYKPHAVLLDILFPDGPLGKTTLARIKKTHPLLPVIMITNTMDTAEYKPEDYVLADYRYSKDALREGDFSDLASQLNRLIEEANAKGETPTDDTGLERYGFIVGKTPSMLKAAETAEKVAPQNHTVLITGESGTGKELIAHFIHRKSGREESKFVAVVCAALPRELLESELFGHEKGAFTGAISQRKGKFELAGNGTIFLDEIGDMPLETQVKLLRFLQEREFERVGGTEVLRSNARIIAATNQELATLIREGRFREDLFYRLNVVSITVPPLRHRKEDIPLLFDFFVKKANEKSRKRILPILRPDVAKELASYSWPGNIREIDNLINRAVALADENVLQVSNFDKLTKEKEPETEFNSDISGLVDSVFNGEIGWERLKDEFGAKSMRRRKVLEAIIEAWVEKHGHGPDSNVLADLLATSPGNMRRVLSECRISLTKYKR